MSVACGSGDGLSPHGAPATLAFAAGSGQTDTVAQLLPSPLDVQVRAASGDPVPGVLVNYTLAADAGTLSSPSSRTRPGGRASTAWTLPERTGNYSVIASVDGLTPVTFQARAIASHPAWLRRVSGHSQVGVEGASLGEANRTRWGRPPACGAWAGAGPKRMQAKAPNLMPILVNATTLPAGP